MMVDFHVHSTASDGVLTPEALAARAHEARIETMALTDHDNVDGVLAFAEHAKAQGLRAVAGIELSVEPGPHFTKFHLLGLGVDPSNAALAMFLKKIVDGRNARNRRMIENFRRLGIEIDDEIYTYGKGRVLAKPHFAKWLFRHGYVKEEREAFGKYLLSTSPKETNCCEPRYHAPVEEAINVLHGAGALCVMAHPKQLRHDWTDETVDYVLIERALGELKEMGLDGLEAIYGDNTAEMNVAFTRIAHRLNLLTSAGSDFHQAPVRTLGLRVDDAFIAPLLERLHFLA